MSIYAINANKFQVNIKASNMLFWKIAKKEEYI
jgi:hypothetical protein